MAAKRPSRGTRAGDGCDSRHGCSVPRGQRLLAQSSGGRFGRMFAFLPHRDAGDRALGDLYRLVEAASTRGDVKNEHIPAGHTYLGQFVDHDITFDPTSKLQRDNDPAALVNFRTPRFDLDSLYGSGPDDQPYLYEWECTRERGVKLLVGGDPDGPAAAAPDLPRNRQGRALIGDARNDEHLIVCQLHLLFIRFHNAVVDHVRGERPHVTRTERFEEAQRIVRWHYQWIVTHDFLERIVGADLAHEVLCPAEGTSPPRVVRRFYAWQDEPSIPVEFSGAAYRFGHSMVRDDYAIRPGPPTPLFADADPHLGGFRPLPADLVIDWRRFFFEQGDPDLVIDGRKATRNRALKINHLIAPPLFALPPDGQALAHLNLQRGRALGLPSGADVAHAMGEEPLSADELLLHEIESQASRDALFAATPLWYYILRESASRADGLHLGRVGGRIVAEVLVGLLEGDPHSYLRQWPRWTPTLPARDRDDFRMTDLVAFVQDAEATAAAAASRQEQRA